MYLLASRRTLLSRISFSCSRRSISEINSSKRFESCPSAASTQSRIQRSRFSPSILPSAVRWQQRRANLSERPLLAPFDPKSRTKDKRCLRNLLAVEHFKEFLLCIGTNNFRDARNERFSSKH